MMDFSGPVSEVPGSWKSRAPGCGLAGLHNARDVGFESLLPRSFWPSCVSKAYIARQWESIPSTGAMFSVLGSLEEGTESFLGGRKGEL